MTYIKNIWVDQDVERPRTYQVTHNADGSITLIDDFGNVVNLGTPVNADHMNHIEDGISNNDTRITALENNKGSGINGLPLGYIGPALFIDESKGYDKYLNGQVIEITETIKPFLNWLKTLIPLQPNLFTTEENWQTQKSLSAFGQVGKFVIDEEAGTIRLPAIVNMQGTFDPMQVGKTIEAGLPNIIGNAGNMANRSRASNSNKALSYQYTSDYNSTGNGLQLSAGNLNFDASKSNPIYGNSDTVQEEAVQIRYFIRVATGETVQTASFNEIKNISEEITNLKAELSNLQKQISKKS